MLREAMYETDKFSQSEKNAITGAYYILYMQKGNAYKYQLNNWNYFGEMRIEVPGYFVMLGYDRSQDKLPDRVYVELVPAPKNWTNQYYLCGYLPVRLIWKPNSYYRSYRYVWETGEFIEDSNVGIEVQMTNSDREEISEEDFIQEVARNRASLPNYVQLMERIEPLPSFEHMRATNRVAAIKWDNIIEVHQWHLSICHEFLRRIALFGILEKCETIEDCFSFLEQETREMNVSQEYSGEVLEQIDHEWNKKICLYYILWTGYEQKNGMHNKINPIPNPFEPLLFLFEGGIHFGQAQSTLLQFYQTEVMKNRLSELPSFSKTYFFDYNRVKKQEKQENRLFQGNASLTMNDINELEATIQRKLPFEQKELLCLTNGGHPEPCDFRDSYTDSMASVGFMFGIKDSRFDLEWIYQEYKDRIPSFMFPLADYGGCLICIGTEGEYEGKVYSWNSEEEDPDEAPTLDNMYFLADSLEEFIDNLR